MNVLLSEPHMRTLAKLQQLAEKHNCVIKIGFKDRFDNEIENNFFRDKTSCNIEILRDAAVIGNEFMTTSILFFELFDKNNESYHTLEYKEIYISFDFELDMYTDYKVRDLIYRLTEDDADDGNCCHIFDEQEIKGFESIPETVENINVYREGIALREFSRLVCDYLGEPRIKEVY